MDTSIWIEHFRVGVGRLVERLNRREVVSHPFVAGELACGNLSNRVEVLEWLNQLPQTPVVSQSEALYFIEHNSLMGQGIGLVDVHLLASTAIAATASLWTLDKRLASVAHELGLGAPA